MSYTTRSKNLEVPLDNPSPRKLFSLKSPPNFHVFFIDVWLHLLNASLVIYSIVYLEDRKCLA